jgi:hypothetical protein
VVSGETSANERLAGRQSSRDTASVGPTAAPADPGLLAKLKAAIMADTTDQQFRAVLNLLQPEESLAVMTGDARVRADTWGTIARSYRRLTGDRSLPIATVGEATAATRRGGAQSFLPTAA